MQEFKRNFYKFLLKEFFIEKINKDIWDRCKDLKLKSNLIFNCNFNFDMIRSIVSSLVIQNKENIEFESTSLYNLNASRFKEESEYTDYVYKRDYLIIYEFGDIDVKTYSDLLTYTISNRILDNKYNILFFTLKKPEELIIKEVLNKFQIINMKNYQMKKISDNTRIY